MKKAIKIIAFLIVLAIVLTGVCKIFKFKHVDGIYPLNVFYELPKNSCDVMFFGTSHVFEGINPAVLWREHGIPAFALAGSSQPLWSTYYYMKEALKYQDPEVIVMDIDSTYYKDEYQVEDELGTAYSRIVKNTIGLRLSLDKWEAVKVSSPPEYWLELMLGFPTYHTRYSELGTQDFSGYWANYPEHWKGYCEHTGHQYFSATDVSKATDRKPMSPKAEEWFYKILELCEEEDVELVLVSIPYCCTNIEQYVYNTVEDIAKEEGIPLINCNTNRSLVGIDYGTDMGDDQHLNYKGSTKMTHFIGQYLTENYDLADRRGTSSIYDSWVENEAFDAEQHNLK